MGWIEALDLVKGLASTRKENLMVRDICRPVEESHYLTAEAGGEEIGQWYIKREGVLPYFISRENGASGILQLRNIVAELLGLREQEALRRQAAGRSYQDLSEQIPLGVAIIDNEGQISYANSLAWKIIRAGGLDSEYLKRLVSSDKVRVLTSVRDRHYRVSVRKAAVKDGVTHGHPRFMVLFTDVTAEYNLMEQLRNARQEAELALAVMLPDQRITNRLQSVVEYTDEYDPSTGKIRITGVISQGTYRHVINILRLVAEAFRQGLMELPGIEKNVLVTAAVFHDLAKVQPKLEVGALVDPKEVFEPGYLHAFRGAALAQGVYGLSTEVVTLIKYHHHEEEELPSDFPEHLLPMYRFFRLVDGLSAGITRRAASVTMSVNGSNVAVKETNPVPAYNRSIVFDLYTGKVLPP